MARAHRAAALVALAVALAGCSPSGGSTVRGEIRDDSIVLDVQTAPAGSTFALTNTGTLPCNDLVLVYTAVAPDALPEVEGRVDLAAPEAFGAGSAIDAFDSVVDPGTTATWTEALPSAELLAPDGTRILLCNGPGDYAAGRWIAVDLAP
jgi:hypothetical protein